jgi:putative membrane-bound dehydrogenase-like protein
LFASLGIAGRARAEPPAAVDDRLVVELVASEPEIVTPTGVAVDERGRIWVIENQTHQRPPSYKGPAGDRIRIFDDFGPDGRARRVKTFAEGFKNGMGLAFGPGGDLYFATRAQILILRDRDGDDVADERREIVRLDTPGDYPHNGLSGFAFDALHNVYFGFGENLGAPYKLIGSDGTTLSGGGEGGNIYRCRPDGGKLVRVATGFWNPFHMTFDAFGRLFAVDNDPDSRPPCRLLHIIPGGDYGYRFRNGRKGLHPFTAWNGELPGTLPMVAGTGEAPSGIVAYESNGLPPEYVGDLIVTSWGDHVIQRFKLAERGASFSSRAETFVRGPDNFYPVGIAVAPDGSLVVSDWADKSYPLHGKGALWRIRMKQPPADDGLRPSQVAGKDTAALIKLLSHPKRTVRDAATAALTKNKATRGWLSQVISEQGDRRACVHAMWAMNAIDYKRPYQDGLYDRRPEVRAVAVQYIAGWATEEASQGQLAHIMVGDRSDLVRLQALAGLHAPGVREAAFPFLSHRDPFLAAAALEFLGRPEHVKFLQSHAKDADGRVRLGVLLALRRGDSAAAPAAVQTFLNDPDASVRRAAIQWVAEENRRELEPLLEAAVSRAPVTRELFEAFLAAKEMLAGVARKPTDEPSGEDFIVKILNDDAQPSTLRAIALRSLRPDHPAIGSDRLQGLLHSDDAGLRMESLRTLAARSDASSQDALRGIAADSETSFAMRAEAVLGLAQSAATSDDTARLLIELVTAQSADLRREALRSLRGAAGRRDVKEAVQNWLNGHAESASPEEIEQAELVLRPGDPGRDANQLAKRAAEFERLAAATEPGDAAAGERVFFHPRGPQCFNCHRVNGRGGAAGPDLSAVGHTLTREKLVASVLAPSKDIAPQYTSWLIATRDGQVHTGVIVEEDPRGAVTLADAQGRLRQIVVSDIEDRRAQPQSIMPENLIDQVTRREFRDLIEFLSRLR